MKHCFIAVIKSGVFPPCQPPLPNNVQANFMAHVKDELYH